MIASSIGWSTLQEKAFIDRLGGHSSCGRSRAELLAGYLAALPRRADWGRIDRAAIEAYAHRLSALEAAE